MRSITLDSGQLAQGASKCRTCRGLPKTTHLLRTRRSGHVHRATTSNAPALLLEVDGVVVDLHMDGHRAAFNKAFASLGFDCVQWPPHMYNDLLGRGDGTPEGFIAAYFELMGWPEMMATSDRAMFLKKVHEAKQEEMFKMLQSGAVPLRDRVQEVLEQAISEGASVAFISGTQSEMADAVVGNILGQLPSSVAKNVQIYPSGVIPQGDTLSSSGRSVEEDGSEGAFEAQLRSAQRGEKQKQALNFAAAFSASSKSGLSSVSIDPNLLASRSCRVVSPEWLQAVASTLGLPPSQCIFIGSTTSIIEAAASAGMTAIVIPRKMAHRGTFEYAKAKFTGYGAGDCTWARLKSLLPKQ